MGHDTIHVHHLHVHVQVSYTSPGTLLFGFVLGFLVSSNRALTARVMGGVEETSPAAAAAAAEPRTGELELGTFTGGTHSWARSLANIRALAAASFGGTGWPLPVAQEGLLQSPFRPQPVVSWMKYRCIKS